VHGAGLVKLLVRVDIVGFAFASAHGQLHFTRTPIEAGRSIVLQVWMDSLGTLGGGTVSLNPVFTHHPAKHGYRQLFHKMGDRKHGYRLLFHKMGDRKHGYRQLFHKMGDRKHGYRLLFHKMGDRKHGYRLLFHKMGDQKHGYRLPFHRMGGVDIY